MNADRPDSRPEDPDHGLDIDAAFAEIVAHWGGSDDQPDTPEHGGSAPGDEVDHDDGPGGDEPPSRRTDDPADPDRLASLFRPAWQEAPPPDPFNSPATWDDEGHFVPPPPPPVPPVDPRRKVAWAGLLGSPAVALLMVIFDVFVPGWASVLLVAAFVGGFGYLVATMRSSPPDDWSGDDGAVV